MAKEKIKGLTVEIDGDILELKKALSEAEKEVKTIDKQLKTLDKALQIDPTNVENLTKKQEQLTRGIEETNKEIQKYKEIQESLDKQGISHTQEEWVNVENKIISAQAHIIELKKQLNTLPADVQAFGVQLNKISEQTGSLATALSKLSGISATALIGGVTSAVSLESDIASIKKVVTDLTDSTIDELKRLAVNTGVSFSEISGYASMAGTLGIAEKDISAFASAMTKLNTSTDGAISGEEGAKSVARFLNLVGEGTDQVGNFGSALVYVADQFATTADEVLATSSAMAGLSSIFNVDASDLIGVSAVLQSLGVTDAVSASTFTKVFQTIETAVDSGGEKLEKFAQVAGYSAEEFATAWKTKPMEAVLEFADGLQGQVFNEIQSAIQTNSDVLNEYSTALGMTKAQFIEAFNADSTSVINQYTDSLSNLSDEEESAVSILSDVSLSNVRYSQTLLKLSGHGQEVKEAIEDSNNAWKDNVALTTKSNTIYETTESRLKGCWEAIKQAGAEMGENLLPVIEDVTEAVKKFTSWFGNLSDGTKKVITYGTLFTATLSPMLKGVSGVTGALGNMLTNTNSVGNKLLQLATNGSGLTSVFSTGATSAVSFATKLGTITGALGPIALGISAVTAGIYLSKKAYEAYSESFTVQAKKILNDIGSIKEAQEEQYTQDLVLLEQENIQRQDLVTSIEEQVNAINTAKENGQEYNTHVETLNTLLSNLNATMDSSTYYYDAETGKITDQQGEVINLKESIEELNKVKAQQTWLDNYQEMIDGYKEQREELQALVTDEKENYTSIAEKLKETNSEAYAVLIEAINQAKGEATMSWQDYMTSLQSLSTRDQTTITSALSSYIEANLSNTAQQISDINTQIDTMTGNYQKMSDILGTDSFNSLSTILGFDTDFDLVNASLDTYAQKIEEIQNKLQIAKDLGDEEKVSTYQATLDEYQAQYDLLLESANNISEQSLGSGGTVENNLNTIKDLAHGNIEEIGEDVSLQAEAGASAITEALQNQSLNIQSAIEDPGSNAIEIIKAQWRAWQPESKTVTIYQKTVSSGGYSSSGYQSGGYGYNSRGYASQGYASGGITLNNTFNITNGNSIDSATVKSWSAVMVDYINEELGKAI